MWLLDWLGRCSQAFLVTLTFAFLLLIGTVDYLTGYDLSFLTFYLLPISLGAWFVGRYFAIGIAALSVAVWLIGDAAAGAVFANKFTLAWNAVIAVASFLIVIWLLDSLRVLLRDLEERVQQRTAALTLQMAERARLEREVLEISEREQRRIGHDLHDDLGQHLTGTALAGKVLGDRLAAQALPEAGAAARLVGLIEDAIELTGSLARGLSPVALEADGLMMACHELAVQTSERFHLDCQFACEPPVILDDPAAAAHLYRIAQEAASNAARHGHPGNIRIGLTCQNGRIILEIADDGIGLDAAAAQARQQGLGLRIMAHRASLLGASFDVSRVPAGGTLVRCSLGPAIGRSLALNDLEDVSTP
jgi:signal transduction histidine kinase